MKYTNILGLPDAIVRAVTQDPYTKGGADFSVTELLKPPRVRQLQKVHDAEITEDVSDRIFALCGQIGHSIIERAGATTTEQLIEERLFAEIDGVKISGQADLFKTTDKVSLWDWKFTTLYAFSDGVKPEYIAQLNMLRWLARADRKLIVSELFSAPIYRDWSKRKASVTAGYPKTQVEIFPVPVWTYEETEAYISSRIALHKAAAITLPECTEAERWAKPDLYKVKKAGGARALPGGVHTTMADAEAFVAGRSGLVIETVKSESVRCLSYCSAAPFCDQAKAILAEMPASAGEAN